MSIRSMTGYATATERARGWVVSVEAKSLNHRGLEVRADVPAECAWLEPTINEMVRHRLERGRVRMRVEVDFDADDEQVAANFIDRQRFAALCSELRDLSKTTATGPVTLGDVLQFRDMLEVSQVAELEEDNPALTDAIERAVEGLITSRAEEGEGIAADMNGHLDRLEARLCELSELLPRELEAFRGRLKERLEEAVADFGAGEIDDERLAQELAIYADKSDVCEELQRADSHVAKLRAILAGDEADEEGAVGKKIDFYLQELVRETNTMGSKSASAKASALVIDMKSTVEKMREQAANIE